jgi:hypothetical protein
MQVLACNFLQKCHKDKVLVVVIATTNKFVERIQMNWATYLVNLLLQDYMEAQEKGIEFHYSWLLILIVLVEWKEPGHYQHMHTHHVEI